MQSTRITSVGFAVAMMAACVASAGEKSPGVGEEKSLGVRLVDQMNALYGAHSGVRANHATGAVFEGTFTPAQGADTLSSAAFLVRRAHVADHPLLECGRHAGCAGHGPLRRRHPRHGDQVSPER